MNLEIYRKDEQRRFQILQAATNEITISINNIGVSQEQIDKSKALTLGLKKALFDRQNLAMAIMQKGFSCAEEIELKLFDHLTDHIKKHLYF